MKRYGIKEFIDYKYLYILFRLNWYYKWNFHLFYFTLLINDQEFKNHDELRSNLISDNIFLI
jgi:hypothetical protein